MILSLKDWICAN